MATVKVRERVGGSAGCAWVLDASGAPRREEGAGSNLSRGPSLGLRRVAAGAQAVLASVFLPDGYPSSVRPEYVTYQCYDTVQALCSYLRGILTTTAILEASGVGKEAASPLAAAIAWVMRDGFGMISSLVFSFVVGSRFDDNVKEWRLFADAINDVGLSLDMLAPLFPDAFVLITSCGAMCKTMCGVAAGATRASITSHFAVRDNLADVSSKESAQETAVTLCGLVLGLGLAKHAELTPLGARLVFGALTAIHLVANYRGVRALQLGSVNAHRAGLLLDALAAGEPTGRAAIASRERLLRPPFGGPRVALGVRLDRVFGGERASRRFALARDACGEGEGHVLWVRPESGAVLGLLAEGTQDEDQLRAFVHAHLVARRWRGGAARHRPAGSGGAMQDLDAEIAEAVRAATAELDAAHSALIDALRDGGWASPRRVHLGSGAYRYSWDS